MADKTSVALAKMAADVTGAAFDASLATLNDAGEIVSYAGKPVGALGYSGLKLAASTPMNVLNAADKGSERLAGFSANILGAGFDATLTTLNEAGEVVAYAGRPVGGGVKLTAKVSKKLAKASTLDALQMLDKGSERLAVYSATIAGELVDATGMAVASTVSDASRAVTDTAGMGVGAASLAARTTAKATVDTLAAMDKGSEALASMSADITGAAFDASLATVNDAGDVVTYAGKNVGKLGYGGIKLTASAAAGATVGTLNALDKSSVAMAGMGAAVLGAGFDATLATLNDAGEVVAYAGRPVGGGVKLTAKMSKKLAKASTIDALHVLDKGSERLAVYSAELAGLAVETALQSVNEAGQVVGAAGGVGVDAMRLAGRGTLSTLGALDKGSEALAKMAADVTGAAFDASLATLNDAGEVIAYAGKPVKGSIKLAGATGLGTLAALDRGSEALANMAAEVTGATFDASLATLNDAGEVVAYAGRPVKSGVKLGFDTTTGVAFGTLAALDSGSELLATATAETIGGTYEATTATVGGTLGAAGSIAGGTSSAVVGTLNAADYASELAGKGSAMAVGAGAGLAMASTGAVVSASATGVKKSVAKDPNKMSKKELKQWKKDEEERRVQAALDAEAAEEEMAAQVAALQFQAEQARLEAEAVAQQAKEDAQAAKDAVKNAGKQGGKAAKSTKDAGGEENPMGSFDVDGPEERVYSKKELKAMQKDAEEKAKEATARAKKAADDAKAAAEEQVQALKAAQAETKKAKAEAKKKVKVPPKGKAGPEEEETDEFAMSEEAASDMLATGEFDWGDGPEDNVTEEEMEIEEPEDEEQTYERASFDDMKLGALKKECKARGLDPKGKKDELIGRLTEDEDKKQAEWQAAYEAEQEAKRDRKKKAAKKVLGKGSKGAKKGAKGAVDSVTGTVTGTAGAAGTVVGGAGKAGMMTGKAALTTGKGVAKGAKVTKDALTSDEVKAVTGGIGQGVSMTGKGVKGVGKGVSESTKLVGAGVSGAANVAGSAAGAMTKEARKERKERKKAAALERKRGHTGLTGQIVGGLNRIDDMTETAASGTATLVGGTVKVVGATGKVTGKALKVTGKGAAGTLGAVDYVTEKGAKVAAHTVGGSLTVAGKTTKLAGKAAAKTATGTLDVADKASVLAAQGAASAVGGTVNYAGTITGELATASAMATKSVAKDSFAAVSDTAGVATGATVGVLNAADQLSEATGGLAAGAVGLTADAAIGATDATVGKAARGTGKMAAKGTKGAVKGSAKGTGKLGKGMFNKTKNAAGFGPGEVDEDGNPIVRVQKKKLEGWEDGTGGGHVNPLDGSWVDDDTEHGFGSDISISSSEEEEEVPAGPTTKRAKLAAKKQKLKQKTTELKDGKEKTKAKHEKRKRDAFLDENVSNNQTKILIIPDHGGTQLLSSKFNAKKAEKETEVVFPPQASAGGVKGGLGKAFTSTVDIDLPMWRGQGPHGAHGRSLQESDEFEVGELVPSKCKAHSLPSAHATPI
jgi:hypothetical protein